MKSYKSTTTNMDNKQQRKNKLLQAAVLGASDSELLVLNEVHQLDDKLEAEIQGVRSEFSSLIKSIPIPNPMQGIDMVKIKGPKGDKPIAGVDFPLPKDGTQGEPGKDYILTSQDKKDIASKIKVPIVEKITEKVEVIREQPIITQEVKEVAITETPEQIKNKLELLEGDERLNKSAIKGMDELEKLVKNVRGGYSATIGIKDITAGSGISIDKSNAQFPIITSTSSSGTEVWSEVVTPSGTSFTLAHTPLSGTVRLYRGSGRQQAGAGNDYTLSGATGTLSVAASGGEVFLADYKY